MAFANIHQYGFVSSLQRSASCHESSRNRVRVASRRKRNRSSFHFSKADQQKGIRNVKKAEGETTSGALEDCYNVTSVKVVGVHKSEDPEIASVFVIHVQRKDESNVTVYRKWKEIKEFEAELLELSKTNEKHKAPRQCLKKIMKDLKYMVTFRRGAMKKLKMIDKLNQFFEAVLNIEEFARSKTTRIFLKPTKTDLDSLLWSGNGKTYLYVATDLLGKEKSKIGEAKRLQQDTIHSDRFSSGNNFDNNLQITEKDDETSPNAQEIDDKSDLIDFPYLSSDSYIAINDFDITDQDTRQSLIGLRKGEEVDVWDKNKNGWWLVSKISCENKKEHDTTVCGYVPASYLVMKRTDMVQTRIEEVSLSKNASPESSCPYTVISSENITLNSEDYEACGSVVKACVKDSISKLQDQDGLTSSPPAYNTLFQEELNDVQSNSIQEEMKTDEANSPEVKFIKRTRARSNTFTFSSIGSEEPNGRLRTRQTTQREIQRRATFSVHIPSGVADISYSFPSKNTRSPRSPWIGEDYISTKAYKASSPDEISFNEAVIIRVLRRNADGWWLASYRDKTGLVPGVHLKKYGDPFRRLSMHMMELL